MVFVAGISISKITYHLFENFTVWGQECLDRQIDTIWYKFPMVTFQEISKLYHLMFKFSICNCLFPNVQYETDTFVVKTIQIWDYVMWIMRFICAKWGQIDILVKTINSHNLRFLSSRIVHIWKTKFFIISVLKFKWYVFENCHFHIKLVIPRSQIISYCILSVFCLRSSISPIRGPCDMSPHWSRIMTPVWDVISLHGYKMEPLFCSAD